MQRKRVFRVPFSAAGCFVFVFVFLLFCFGFVFLSLFGGVKV